MEKKQTDFGESIKAEFKEAFANLDENENVQAMKETAKEFADEASILIRKYPLQAVAVAAVAGFIAAQLLRRKND